MEPDEPMAEIAREDDPNFYFSDKGHYDGVYFYAIARDPLLRGEAHTLIDLGAYRYGHAGYGWAAALLSFGQPVLVPWALLAIGSLSTVIAAVLASKLAVRLGFSPWLGLAVSLNPGLLYAVSADTAEPFGICLALLGLLLWLDDRYVAGAIVLVCATLVKEPLVMVAGGIFFWELWKMRKERPPRELLLRLGLLSLSPIVLLIWYLRLAAIFGIPFNEIAPDYLDPPFVGWLDTFGKGAASGLAEEHLSTQIGSASLPMNVAAAGLLLVGVVAALRMKNVIQPIFLLMTALILVVTWAPLLFAKDFIRTFAFIVVFIPFVLARPLTEPVIRDST